MAAGRWTPTNARSPRFLSLWDANGAEPSTSFSAHGAAVLGNVRHAHLVRCLFGKTRRRHRRAPMRGCDAACPQAPGSAAAVSAGRSLMRTVRIRRNRRTRARSPTTEVAPTDARRTIFPVPCRHSRTPTIQTWMTSQTARMKLARQLPGSTTGCPRFCCFSASTAGHVDMIEWPGSAGEEAP